MDNQENKISSFFKLFNHVNLQVAFNVVGNDVKQHVEETNALVDLLLKQGYSVDPQGLDNSEEIREVQGWVLGSYNDRNTGKSENCVYLYGPEFLEWKVATVWKEDIPNLPITVSSKETPWKGSAPDRAMAVREGVLNHTQFKIVMEQRKNFNGEVLINDKTGKPTMIFSRVYGQAKVAKEQSKNEEPEDVDFSQKVPVSKIDTFPQIGDRIDKRTQAGKFIKWCRDKQKSSNNGVASEEAFDLLVGTIDEITDIPATGNQILSVCTGIEIDKLPDEINSTVVSALLELLSDVVMEDNGEITGKNDNSKRERYAPAIMEINQAIEDVMDTWTK